MDIVNLFGSAMNIQLWQNFIDVSEIRPVPDHQEVFMHKDQPISLIIELNEHDDAVYTEYGPARDYFPTNSPEEKGLFNILLYNLQEYAQDKSSEVALPILRVRKVTTTSYNFFFIISYHIIFF